MLSLPFNLWCRVGSPGGVHLIRTVERKIEKVGEKDPWKVGLGAE